MRPSRPRAAARSSAEYRFPGLAVLAAAAVAGTAVWAALPLTALGAGAFDGTYRGSQRTIQTNNSADCSRMDRDNTTISITDNHFTRRWGEAELSVDVGADGSFEQKALMRGKQLRTAVIKGKVTGGMLEADIGTPLCSVHLSLKKS
ncbi:MAG: hypothetical protein JSR21_11090 [Proteobacteria bacterium]|nr:hypothetical protein [Pseudomonadota bacterium]